MPFRFIAVLVVAFGCRAHVGVGVGDPPPDHSSAAVRYEVSQIEPSVAFYKQLGFVVWKRDRTSAVMNRGNLTLLLDAPRTPGARPAADAEMETSSAWNRIVLYTDDLNAQRYHLECAGIVLVDNGFSAERLLVRDPDGNPVEIRQAGNRVAWQ